MPRDRVPGGSGWLIPSMAAAVFAGGLAIDFDATNALLAGALAALLLLGTHERVWPIGRAVTAGAAIGIIGVLAVGLVQVAASNVANPPDWDFKWFWIQGSVAAEGLNFYEPGHAAQMARELGLGAGFIEELGFWYPPVTMLLFAPLGLLELPMAVAVISIAIGIAIVLDAVLLWRLFLSRLGVEGVLVTLALLLLLRPTLSTIGYGQTNFLVLLAVLAAWMARDRALAGVAFVLGMSVKLVVAPVGIVLLFRSPRSALLAGLGTAVVLVGAAVIAFSPDVVATYLIDNPTARAPDWLYSQEVNQSLLAVSIRTTGASFSPGPSILNYLYLNLAIVVIGVTAVLAADRRVEHGFAMGAAIVAGTLIFPGTLEHYAVLLIAPLLHLWSVRDRLPLGVAWIPALVGGTYALVNVNGGQLTTAALGIVWLTVVGSAGWIAYHRAERPATRAVPDDGRTKPMLLEPAPPTPMTGVAESAASASPPDAPSRVRHLLRTVRLPRTAITLTLSLVALYMTMAVIVTLAHHSIVGDAWSRIANAYYVLYSRDPHLAAMGFVWNPLPSLMALPLLPFGAVWPPLIREGFVANLYSVLFMALAAYHLWRLSLEAGVRPLAALGLTVLFAVHPMIIEYGANGMTEALFIFLLIVIVRYLAQWVRTGATAPLVIAALATAASYLVRYEAAPMAAALGGMIGIVSFLRVRGTLRERGVAAAADVALYAVPVASMFFMWAAASWMIIGQPFEQFSSTYGTTSQLAADAENIYYGTGQGTLGAVAHTIRQVLGLQPFFLVLIVAGGYAAFARRDASVVPALVAFGAILAFAIWAFLTGKTGGWLRYYITIIPFATVMAAWAIGALQERATLAVGRGTRAVRVAMAGLAALFVLASGTGVATGVGTMVDGALGRPERYVTDTQRWETSRQIADYLDKLELDDGSVLLDVFLGFPIVMQTQEPRQFVITPDRDFDAMLADPVTFGVEYILVPPPEYGLNELDAVNRAYPDLFDDGAGIATFVHHFPSDARGGDWKLYRVEEGPTLSSP